MHMRAAILYELAWVAASTLASSVNLGFVYEDLFDFPRISLEVDDTPLYQADLAGEITRLRQENGYKEIEDGARSLRHEQRPQDVGHTRLGTTPDESIPVEPIVMRTEKGHQYLCRVPVLLEEPGDNGNKDSDDDGGSDGDRENGEHTDAQDVDIRKLHERNFAKEVLGLLAPLGKECLIYTDSARWWSYEYCHQDQVRQFQTINPEDLPHAKPKMEFVLGTFEGMLADVSKKHRGGQILDATANVTITKTAGRRRYASQVWKDGTECDITGRPRQIEIQYYCDPGHVDHIAHVRETSICNYLMVINTNLLCQKPEFYHPISSRTHTIYCNRVFEDEAEYLKVLPSSSQDTDHSEGEYVTRGDDAEEGADERRQDRQAESEGKDQARNRQHNDKGDGGTADMGKTAAHKSEEHMLALILAPAIGMDTQNDAEIELLAKFIRATMGQNKQQWPHAHRPDSPRKDTEENKDEEKPTDTDSGKKRRRMKRIKHDEL
ncbi:Protein OS-9 [Spiromyces aspiralis]|uniref:Protein OS-9 n=1 Tax=Spiromyces aspiralis TaxID=68401 RepID=A0ACC1HJ47_9FUNG|nr:Protein OS-9 [Spiromyces aspiralis]